jgi:hypothetical protein
MIIQKSDEEISARSSHDKASRNGEGKGGGLDSLSMREGGILILHALNQ